MVFYLCSTLTESGSEHSIPPTKVPAVNKTVLMNDYYYSD